MQTFLPYTDFAMSAKVLDRQRLGKQRVEAKQILTALNDPNYGWQDHPAVKMWRGYEIALATYGWFICHEWKGRGYKDTCMPFFNEWMKEKLVLVYPSWLNDEFCISHRSNLIRKLPSHYQPIWPEVRNDLPYIWPV